MGAPKTEPFAYPMFRIVAVAGTMTASIILDPGWRLVAVGFGSLVVMVSGYLTLRSSSMSVEERIMVWVRGRGMASGADIAQGIGIGSGALYPALSRMEQRGDLTSRWENDEPLVNGKPRRRLYQVPPHKVIADANAAITEFRRAPEAEG